MSAVRWNGTWDVISEGNGGPEALGVNYPNGSLMLASAGSCYCPGWYVSRGNNLEGDLSNAADWIAFSLSLIFLIYYGWATWKATCGWEEVYVCTVEMVKVIVDQYLNTATPATLYLSTGNRVLWIRYGEWLLTCPVILIHLSNITGLKDDYNKRTMKLLVSDIGTIVFGVTSAAASGWVKALFFVIASVYGANTFFHAAKVYIQSYHMMPKGRCKELVRAMAWIYYVSWGMFPVLFVLGPEGFNKMNLYQSNISHTVIDLMSKNIWGMMGHILRRWIHTHILIHGDLRKTTKINIAGEEMEVETFMAADEADEDTVKHPTKALANRDSFVNMRDKLKEKGFDVRASLEASTGDVGIKAVGMGMGMGMGAIDPGRVILSVPDITMVDFFREQFASLPATMELVPALGVDATLQIVQQAMPLGGCDFILLHPEFLRDNGPNGLVARLRASGQRICAFGWSKAGPVRDLIESSNIDGYLEGPSFGTSIQRDQLLQLVANMQARKKAAAQQLMSGMAMGMNNGMGMGMGMNNGMGMGMNNGMGMGMNNGMGMGMNNNMGMGMNNNMGMGMGSMNSSMGGAMAAQQQMQQQQVQMARTGSMAVPSGGLNMGSFSPTAMGGGMSPGATRMGTNPLYGTAPSPLSSQPGAQATAVPQGQAAPAAKGNEAEMLQQLMSEINRLRNELGEQ